MIKGLTIHQPWAWLIANGFKTIETRFWYPDKYRGWLAIHAGKTHDQEAEDAFRRVGFDGFPDEFTRGAVVALGRIDNIYTIVDREDVARGSTAKTLTTEQLYDFYDRDAERHPFSNEAFDGTDDTPARFGWYLADVLKLRTPIPTRGYQKLWGIGTELEGQLRAAYLDAKNGG